MGESRAICGVAPSVCSPRMFRKKQSWPRSEYLDFDELPEVVEESSCFGADNL